MDDGAPQIVDHGRILASDFRPHPLLTNPHLQTIVAGPMRPSPPLRFEVERWERPDGDFLDLGWFGKGSGPLVLMLHGLTGGFESKYARGLGGRLLRRGWRGVLMQFRGAGSDPNRLDHAYHHGDTADVLDLIPELRRRHPDRPLYAVGWSLGGNVLLKALGETGARNLVDGAVAVSVPFALAPCAARLRTGFSRVYQNRMLKSLKEMMRRKFEGRTQAPINLADIRRARDFIEFDNHATAPLNGFLDAADYYARASSGRYLCDIRTRTHIIHAEDDPFMSPAIVPKETDLPPDVTLEVTTHGGHVGFVAAGAAGRPRWWLERRIEKILTGWAAETPAA